MGSHSASSTGGLELAVSVPRRPPPPRKPGSFTLRRPHHHIRESVHHRRLYGRRLTANR